MPDREKVIKGLEDSFANQGCGYMDGVGELYAVSGEDLQNAIALLKEQDNCENCAIAIEDRQPVVRCKDCKHWDKGYTEECSNTDSVCFHNGWCKPDWFYADGERR